MGAPGERCEAAANGMREVLGGSCKLGQVRARVDESGESREFDFVCHASRARIVEAIAAAAGALLESQP